MNASASTRWANWNLPRSFLTRARKGRNALVPIPRSGFPRKSALRGIATCARNGGAYTTHNRRDCCRFEKDGKEKSNFCAAKKGEKKGNPVNQNFAQLTKKIKKLKKVLKKSGKKG